LTICPSDRKNENILSTLRRLLKFNVNAQFFQHKFDEGTTAEKMASPQMPVGPVREPPQHWPGKADIVFLPIGWKFDSP
jgi:hypothetical protein